MEPYIEFIGTLQNSGFWLVKVSSLRSFVTATVTPMSPGPVEPLPHRIGLSFCGFPMIALACLESLKKVQPKGPKSIEPCEDLMLEEFQSSVT